MGDAAVHDPGEIITDLAVALALGGDCLAADAPRAIKAHPRGPLPGSGPGN